MRPFSPETPRLTRQSPFSYTCHRCARCCYDKRIPVNPYEIARLARNRGIGTTEFLERYLQVGKPYLRVNADGSCVFLTDQGCGVHSDRPTVCRLYPLGEYVTSTGEEYFVELTPDPETAGIYGREGTVEAFLLAHGVQPFLEARDAYLKLVYQMLEVLAGAVEYDADAYETMTHTLSDEDAMHQALKEWLDMDRVVSQYCLEQGLDEPTALDERLALHLTAMEKWIQIHIKGEHDGKEHDEASAE